ncbi:glycosyltransferase family 2 protein [Candidatus Saccharibacteria bacterium]|nr:glycosyltransferase family 2 protein [Candidatus Saccharibacteria bacterium]
MKKKSQEQRSPLVSIVIPTHNSAKYIAQTIGSVQGQTYHNWELIIVDDCSADDTVGVISKHASEQVKLVCLNKNQGAAIARNTGTKEARGDYLAFLDADDLWLPEKLERQVKFMQEKDCEFSFTGYEFADAEGRPNGKVVHVPATITYKQALRNTTISTIAVMFDMKKLSKVDIEMPNIASEDTATWWKILKKIECAYGLDEPLAIYRRSNGTLSANKVVAILRIWRLYRKQESLNALASAVNFAGYAVNAVRRRV